MCSTHDRALKRAFKSVAKNWGETMRTVIRRLFLAGFITALTLTCSAQNSTEKTSPLTLNVPAAAQPSPNFDVKAATDAWLATVPADKKAKSDAYFEGGYWLLLWDFLVSAAILIWFLQSRLSARIRDWAERVTKNQLLQTLLYFIPLLIITTVLQFPLTVYEGYFREHKYGLANQSFGPWFTEQLVGLAIGSILGGIAVVGLFAIDSRIGKSRLIWGGVASFAFQYL